jgi:hypothetical protein
LHGFEVQVHQNSKICQTVTQKLGLVDHLIFHISVEPISIQECQAFHAS